MNQSRQFYGDVQLMSKWMENVDWTSQETHRCFLLLGRLAAALVCQIQGRCNMDSCVKYPEILQYISHRFPHQAQQQRKGDWEMIELASKNVSKCLTFQKQATESKCGPLMHQSSGTGLPKCLLSFGSWIQSGYLVRNPHWPTAGKNHLIALSIQLRNSDCNPQIWWPSRSHFASSVGWLLCRLESSNSQWYWSSLQSHSAWVLRKPA